jgi:YD repeat-containing protein
MTTTRFFAVTTALLLMLISTPKSVARDIPCPCQKKYQLRDTYGNTFIPAPNPTDGLWGLGDYVQGLADTPTGNCASEGPLQCWRSYFFSDTQRSMVGHENQPVPGLWATGQGVSRGFPFNIDLFHAPATVNYPPLSQSAVTSTAPFVSDKVETAYRPLFLSERETIAGVVDAATGQPLLRAVDLELPVGRAQYRMIRSYGGDLARRRPSIGTAICDGRAPAIAKQWDWAGTGWMISENPLLMFDANYIDHDVKVGSMCFLILDAHHSIPFTQDPVTGNYIAPAWFDAVMEIPGLSSYWTSPVVNTAGHWVSNARPTTVRVHLYNQSVTYTFELSEYALPLKGGSTTRTPPPVETANETDRKVEYPRWDAVTDTAVFSGGWGTPMVGLLQRIDDHYGNAVEINYCGSDRFATDTSNSECNDCVHNCTQQGQIRSVILKTGATRYEQSSGSTAWTLAYVHRSFRQWAPNWTCGVTTELYKNFVTARDADSKWFMQNAVHAVYVYPGAVELGGGCPTLDAWDFVHRPGGSTPVQSMSEYSDPSWDWEALTNSKLGTNTVPTGWRYRMRYTYDEVFMPLVDQATNELVTAFGAPSAMPGIFTYGTPVADYAANLNPSGHPFQSLAVIGSSEWAQGRPVPHLLMVERTERISDLAGATEPALSTSVTAYVYASRYDLPSKWAAADTTPLPIGHSGSGVTDAEQAARIQPSTRLVTDPYSFTIAGDIDLTPQIKYVFTQRDLSKLRETGGVSVGEMYHPKIIQGAPWELAISGVSTKSYYLSDFASMQFEWAPNWTKQSSASLTTADDVLSTVAAAKSPFMEYLVENCIVANVPRERLQLGARPDVVNRLRLAGSGTAADGWYDLAYFSVAPPGEGTAVDGSPLPAYDPLPNGDPRVITAEGAGNSKYNNVFIGNSNLWDNGYGPYSEVPENLGLFPFLIQPWRALPGSCDIQGGGQEFLSNRVGGMPLSEPQFIVMVDRHDGYTLDNGGTKYRYSLNALMAATSCNAGGTPDNAFFNARRPHSRQVVALNGAGYKLFQRIWDYQTGGIEAKGPAEQFIYSSSTRTEPDPSGSGDRTVLAGLRLDEHRSLGWGVAYVNSANVGGFGCVLPSDCSGPAGSTDMASQGLITTYKYFDTSSTKSQYVTEIGVKEGICGVDNGYAAKVKTFNYAAGSTPGLPGPLTGTSGWVRNGSGTLVAENETFVRTEYYDSPANTKVRVSGSWRSAAETFPGGPLLSPFSVSYYSAEGVAVANAYGLVEDPARLFDASPSTPDDHDLVFVDATAYMPDTGLPVLSVVDIATRDSGDPVVGSVPASWLSSTVCTDLPGDSALAALQVQAGEYVTRAIPSYLEHLLPPVQRCTGTAYNQYFEPWHVGRSDGLHDYMIDTPHVVRKQFLGLVNDSSLPPNYVTIHYRATLRGMTVVPGSGSSSTMTGCEPGSLAVYIGNDLRHVWTVDWQTVSMTGGYPILSVREFNIPVGQDYAEGYFDEDMAEPSVAGARNYWQSLKWKRIADASIAHDDHGRPEKITADANTPYGWGSTPLEQSAVYTDFGLIAQSLSVTGQRTRLVHNPLGLLQAEFTGTEAESACWGIDPPAHDNMTLLRRHYYGEDVQNIRKVIRTRHPRSAERCSDVTYDINEDGPGYEVEFGYDRRMRRVSELTTTDAASRGSRAAYKHEMVWHDNLDRVRLRAAFVGDFGSAPSLDPRTRNVYGLGPPSAVSILEHTNPPVSLTEYIYNARGLLQEERAYDVRDASGETFEATRTYFDHRGEPMLSISSSGRAQRTVRDALGRIAATTTIRGDQSIGDPDAEYELERTDYTYHANGQPEVVSHFTRVHNDASLALEAGTSGNAVRSDTINWYNSKGQLTATAVIGTQPVLTDLYSTADLTTCEAFTNTEPAPTPPSQLATGVDWQEPPTWIEPTSSEKGAWVIAPSGKVPSSAIITTYTYDALGRVASTRDSSGMLTERKYDGFGRVVEETVTAPAYPTGESKTTAYRYGRGGQLHQIAHLTSDHVRDSHGAPRWNGPSFGDPTIQVTELIYENLEPGSAHERGAKVVDSSGTEISRTFDLPKAVKFNSVTCPCNVIGSSQVTLDDLTQFLAWHGSNDSRADIDGNGVVNAADITQYMECYYANFNQSRCGFQWANTVNDGYDLQFTYTVDGQIAGRSDALGNSIAYAYDPLSRCTEIDVAPVRTHAGRFYSADTVERIEYGYDVLGRLTRAASYAKRPSTLTEYLVAESEFTHDPWGRLLTERLGHGTGASGMPAITYTWSEIAPTTIGGPVTHRLNSIEYPWGPGLPFSTQPPSKINLGYGTVAGGPTGLDNAQHRIRRMDLEHAVAGTIGLMQIGYAGASMRASADFGIDANGSGSPALRLSMHPTSSGTPSIPGLDLQGRMRIREYVNIDPVVGETTIWKGQYAYDAAGNRTSATHSALIAPKAEWRWQSEYDGFNRLCRSSLSEAASSGLTPDLSYRQSWGMDVLGNWGLPTTASEQGLIESYFSSGSSTPTSETRHRHSVNPRSEVLSVNQADRSGGSTTWGTETAAAHIYDSAGRLVVDKRWIYQYDAFGRLTQVRRLGNAVTEAGGSWSAFNPENSGSLVMNLSYDGLGRVIRIQRADGALASTVDVTDLVYDGARVVQELGMRVFDAVVLEPPTGGVDLTPKTRALLASELAGLDLLLLDPSQGRVLRREYAYALDEAADVDECIAQWSYPDPHPPSNPILESEGSTWPVLTYVLQDANLNVVGLTDIQGRPVAHFDYTPYGVTRTAIHADHSSLPADLSALVTARSNRLGHQGLRFERLDRPWESLYGDIPGVAATSVGGAGQVFDPSEVGSTSGTVTTLGSFHGVYLNRNRVYEPWIGRFTSVDPNGLGGPVQDALAFRGRPNYAQSAAFSLDTHFADGWNVHGYLQQSPCWRRDASGLMSAIEIGNVGGIQGIISGIFNGAASLSASLSGLATSSGIWAIGFASNGALVASQNADSLMMAMSHFDAHVQEYYRQLLSAWDSYGSGGPQYDPNKMTTSKELLARDWGYTVKQVGDAIHRVKSDGSVSGRLQNPDLVINRVTGDAFIKGTVEFVGNVKDMIVH